MTDYEPLDLSAVTNAPLSLLKTSHAPATGDASLRGIPFRFGAGDRALVSLRERAEAAVVVPVHRSATWVVFAHVLLESRLHEGDPPGRQVAHYTFRYDDGSELTVPIRERYEIAVSQIGWGEHPFLAVPDLPDSLMSRYEGAWGQTGFRQTEARQSWPRDYYLWAWRNPHPEKRLASVEIAATGEGAEARAFAVAGITLSSLEEDPFHREARLGTRIELKLEEDVKPPFALSVEVDRGVTTYAHALPVGGGKTLVDGTHPGWGEAQNPANSPAYAEIAASPSATVTVKKGDEVLGAVNWGEAVAKGTAETERIRVEVVDKGRNWVHTTVLDDETGKPVPCRVHFRSPEGIPYQPHGHHNHVNSNLGTWHIDVGGDVRLGQISYAYIDGKCQGWLPRGEVVVDVARGYEYEPIREKARIEPGQRELTLRLKRHSNLNRERYFSGDTHVHFLSTQGALTEAAAEDLDVVNLLLSQWGHLFTNSEEFIGRPVQSGDRETIVYASQENRQHLLGHLTLLGLKEPVMPWCSDGPSEAEMGGNLETTMSRWADACHAQGGTVVIPHLPNPNGEPAALIATGRADAVEFLVHNPFFHLEYYRYLNGGYRLPLVGGTDKMDSGVPVGMYRTYAHIPPDEEFTYDNWCKAVRGGNTFLSGGPLLRLSVDGQPMGSAVRLGPDGGTVTVEARATSILPIHCLQVVMGTSDDSPLPPGRGAGGEGAFGGGYTVLAMTEETKGARELRVRAEVRVEGPTWICARCAGPGYEAVKHFDSWMRGIMAHTSPVYVECGGQCAYSQATMEYMLTLIDGSLQHIRHRSPQWKPGTVTHHHGHEDHIRWLEEPFHEAAAAIHRKMHDHGIPH